MILRNIALIDSDGSHIGQIDGLSVTSLAGYSFGRATRITCRVRPGAGKIVDIEREVELGGPLHSQGVLILAGFLAGRYALDAPMSLSASLVFEQSYGGVEGDSAFSAELYALLPAIGEIPLRNRGIQSSLAGCSPANWVCVAFKPHAISLIHLHRSWSCTPAGAAAFWFSIRFLEDSWLDGQVAPICLFTTDGFRRGSASAWRGWAG
jgi:hypothetical protein